MEATGDSNLDLDEPSKWGLKLLLNHEYPLQTKQLLIPKPNQILDLVPLSARYVKYYCAKRMQKKRPIMDYFNTINAQRIHGCPIGGIGGGTIGRGFKGEFCRFQLYPGIYEYITVPECQFIVNIRNEQNVTIFQSVLSTYNKPKKAPTSWEWNLDSSQCEYTALYPRAWTTYDLSKYGIKLVCRQISPIIPHNYKDSSLPCAVFVFTAKNVCNERRTVNITFTWTEIPVGVNKRKNSGKLDLERYSEENTCGVTLEQRVSDTQLTFTIAKNKSENETIHEGYCLWNSLKTSSYVWECIKKNGKLEPDPSQSATPPKGEKDKIDDSDKPKKIYKNDSIGLSNSISLDPGGCDVAEFCLVWDMPMIKYKKERKVHKRYYTKYFGSDGIAGASIAAYALRNYKSWEKQLAEWQDPILNNSNIPDWLKSALMNELYYVADGGTIWFDVSEDFPETDPRHDFGVFGYLEGHEYRMYNTYDVHFYASFALAQLWPNLQRYNCVVLQYMYRDAIALETTQCRQSLYDGKYVKFKIKESIPHDLGDPEDIPFTNINAYNIHDVSEWRDLNLKYILQVMRDYRLLRAYSAPFPNERYYSMAYIDDVREGTENDLYTRSTEQPDEKSPDLSVDLSLDPSPVPNKEVPDILDLLYRSSEVVQECQEIEDPKETVTTWNAKQYLMDMYPSCAALLRKGLLWDKDGDGLIENGGFPDQTYDAWVMSGPSAYCGSLWVASISVVRAMAHILGQEEDEREFSKILERAKTSFGDKLWNGSFYKFDTKPSNKNVVMADQLAGQWFLRASDWNEEVFPEANSMEVWPGVTFGLASLMIYEGMHEQAFAMAGGLYNTLTKMGLAFETPEALYENGNHRSIAYMRPLSIWSMYQAIIARPPRINHVNGQIHGKHL
ncbi:unnamed protein product [Pieris macdunnoughi]|uniref:NLGase n=1 Tax=Pieris macdunnoughi TaxID=345717 RepID=A0A821Y4E0_9NEOP|nr:unnamed protein product [Pieris macdunnoughi]